MADKWDQYATDDAKGDDKWEQYALSPSQLPSLNAPPSGTIAKGVYEFGQEHPNAREAILGAAAGAGIPESKTPIKDLAKGAAATFALGPNPGEEGFDKVMSYIPVAGPVYRMGAGLGEQTAGFLKELGPLYEHLKSGAGVTDSDRQQAIHGGAGLTTEVLSLLWGAKKPEVIPGESSANRVATATGAYPSDIAPVMGDLEKSAKANGKPADARGLIKTTQDALTANKAEFDAALNAPSPAGILRDKKVVPIDISDAIKKKITPEMAHDPEGRKMAAALQNASVAYQHPWRLGEIYERMQRYNKELRAYYGKAETAQAADVKTKVDVMVKKAFVDTAKDILYPEMDNAEGKPSGYFRDLQQRQGHLQTIKDAANHTVEELERKDAMIKGLPLSQKAMQKASVYLHPLSGRGGVSLHKLNEPIGVTKLDFANKSARNAFKSTLLEDAFAGINQIPPIEPTRSLPVITDKRKQLTPLQ